MLSPFSFSLYAAHPRGDGHYKFKTYRGNTYVQFAATTVHVPSAFSIA